MSMNTRYAVDVYTIVKGIEATKGTFVLDPRKQDHFACIAGMFGGEDNLQAQFPLHHGILQLARDSNGGAPAGGPVDHKRGFEDYATVEDIAYNAGQNQLYTCGYTNLVGKAKALYQTLFIYRNGTLIDQNTSFDYNTNFSFIEKTVKDIKAGSDDEEITIVVHSSWQPNDRTTFCSMLSYDIRDTMVAPLDEVVSSIEVGDPRHKTTPETSNINVAYGRRARAGETLDYTYSEVRLESLQKVFLENRGTVTLRDDVEFVSGEGKQTSIVLNHQDYGTIWYQPAVPATAFTKKAANKFTWDIPYNWDNVIPSSVMAGERVYAYDLHLSFYAKKAGKNPELYSVNVTSYQKEANPHYKKISNIKLFWGCLHERTIITMADGSTKAISDIVLGDMVKADSGHPVRVSEVFTGTEPSLYVLVTDDGHELQATFNHPVMTDNGMVPLMKLSIGDRLVLEDGRTDTLRQCFPIAYNGQVYNLDLEEEAGFYANGILVGGFTAQNRSYVLQEDALVPDELRREIDKLRDMYK